MRLDESHSQAWERLTQFNQTLQFDKTDTTYSNSPSIYRLEAQYNCAILLADPTDGLTNVKPENYSGVDFRVLKESYGNKKWQQLYSYPEYGLGIHQGFYYLPDAKPGIPTSVYGFFNAPFRKKENWESRYEIIVGLSYCFWGNNPPSNSDGIYDGSRANVRVGFGYENRFNLSSNLKGSIGFNFIHYSNGYTNYPNPGKNLISLTFNLLYGKQIINISENTTSDHHFNILKNPLPSFKPFWEFYGIVSFGLKTIEKTPSKNNVYHSVFSASTDICRHYSYKGKITIGMDIFYDGSLQKYYRKAYPNSIPNSKLWYYGIHFGHEWIIHRFSIITQIGWMLKDVSERNRVYGRLAFRYNITQNLFTRVGLKLPSKVEADFLEWGIGVNLYK